MPGTVARANCRRNSIAEHDRTQRWASTREAAWESLTSALRATETVCIVGAGNGDDLPLARLAERAGSVDLVDLDPVALRRARRRVPRRLRGRVKAIQQDVSAGYADELIDSLRTGASPPPPCRLPRVGRASYDLVVGDLFYTQLLYPALLDHGHAAALDDPTVIACAQAFVDEIVRSLHCSTSSGRVLHLHDLAGWWPGHPQPLSPADALDADEPRGNIGLRQPIGCDPSASVVRLGGRIISERYWLWPFADGAQYLVSASLAELTASGSS